MGGSIDNMPNNANDTDTSEYNIGIDYAPSMLDGLHVSLVHGKHEKDPAGAKNTVTTKETRIIVSYDLGLF